MLSLKMRLDELKTDLLTEPVRITTYHNMPFAIFRYDPQDEFECRNYVRLLAIDLEQNFHKKIHFISLGKLLWKAIEVTEGVEAIINDEKIRGFDNAQTTVHSLISDDKDFMPLPGMVLQCLAGLEPQKNIVFIVRAAALAPHIYRCSTLLDKLHGHTMVPIILFYPGTAEGQTDLKFMGIDDRGSGGAYNYRVKIYGGV